MSQARKPTKDEVIQLIAVITRLPKEKITPQANLRADLMMDSLAALDLFVSIEEQYGLVVKQEEVARLATVGEVLSYFEGL